MEIDIILEPDLAPRQVAELGVVAERYGARAVWSSNFFAHWDCFLSLVPLLQATQRLLVGPLAVSPFEMHPLKIANSLLSLNEMSAGRAVIAMGAGEGNIDAMNLPRPPKIVRAVREAIEIVRGAGRGELAKGYKGEDFQVNYPCAYQWIKSTPPLVYGTAYRGMMMRMEARVSDGVYIGCTPPEVMAEAMAEVNEGAQKRAAGMAPLRTNTFWAWHLKRDRKEGYRESRRELAWRARKLEAELLAQVLNPDEVRLVRDNYDKCVAAWFDRSGNIQGMPESIPNRLCEYFTSTGGLEDIDREIERFRMFGRAGLTEVALRLHDDPMESLQIIGERVIPALRA
ncbi:MAG TPA: LLM class flavin-dependent oxidoreductase [Steroidobacteraceae bacterium]|nr:LLM class flavin-dependent oxidoreductase [Steroidobacteraceae bacterium]